ncbi:MAG: hypothetical protein WC828_01135 [Thermoleophilia bacterium]|jgi:hypothetical protein
MKMFDCDICLSAGSVNQWGFCEICGEEFENTDSLIRLQLSSTSGMHGDNVVVGASREAKLISIGQDAA